MDSNEVDGKVTDNSWIVWGTLIVITLFFAGYIIVGLKEGMKTEEYGVPIRLLNEKPVGTTIEQTPTNEADAWCEMHPDYCKG